MTPTPLEIVVATSTPQKAHNSHENNGAEATTTATAAAPVAPSAATATTKSSDSNTDKVSLSAAEATQSAPSPPDIGSTRVGSDMLIMTPEQIAEAYEKTVQAEERKRAKAEERGWFFRKPNLRNAPTAFRDRLLLIVGKILRFILHLDMHGGTTGNNINFVGGLIDFLAGSLGEFSGFEAILHVLICNVILLCYMEFF